MSDKGSNQTTKNEARELLLADYKYLRDSFWKNEETGESRIKFFITLVTAVLAALATLLKGRETVNGNNFTDITVFVIIFSLFSLFIIGIITLLRIIKRNEVTDGYKRDMEEIRERYKFHFGAGVLDGYFPHRDSPGQLPRYRKIGGLAHTVSAINSLILGALASIFFCKLGLPYMVIASIIVFLLTLYIQFNYIRIVEKQRKERLFTHAGGVVVKFENNEPRYLIVSAKKTPEHWVLPKGHIEEGEVPETTAIREVKEETGITAKIIASIGSTMFFLIDEFIYARFYIMRYISKTENGEKRRSRWCSYEEAQNLLTFNDTKRLLNLAQTKAKTMDLKKTRQEYTK